MKTIVLDCDKSLSTISGSDNGVSCARLQIIPQIDRIKSNIVVKIPDYILFVGGSFMSGIYRELSKRFSREEIRKYIKVESVDETVAKEFGEQWTINLH